MNRRAFLRIFSGALAAMLLGATPTQAATVTETWANLDNWNVENPANCYVSGGKLIVTGSVVLRHKTLVLRRNQPMSIAGWLSSRTLTTQTPTYFGAVLQAVSDGNYYGSAAICNWVDDANGIFRPSWLLFGNEWQLATQTWSKNIKLPKPIAGQHAYRVGWAPSVSDGSRGCWAFKLENGKLLATSTDLPLPSDCRPSLGFGRGQAECGPVTMVGGLA